jgi:uncharacterized protein YfkK (UPF0435 family)
MKLLHRLTTYILLFICIVTFGLFIYPGLYKYDKLNQKLPVKINRITGSTQILTQKGWQDAEDYDAAKDELSAFKQDIYEQIMDQNEDIKQEVLAEIKEQLEDVKNDVINETNSTTSKYDDLREDMGIKTNAEQSISKETFSKGDTVDRVKEIMGTPSGITEIGNLETWYYGFSTISFKDGKVNGWQDFDGNLLVK